MSASLWCLVTLAAPRLRVSGAGRSGPHEPGDGVGGLADLLLAFVVRAFRGLDDAAAEVVLDEPDAHRLQRLGHRGDLREDVDAVDVLVDHAGDAAHLALDPAQAPGVLLLALAVAVHACSLLVGPERSTTIPLPGIGVYPCGIASEPPRGARDGSAPAGRMRRRARREEEAAAGQR